VVRFRCFCMLRGPANRGQVAERVRGLAVLGRAGGAECGHRRECERAGRPRAESRPEGDRALIMATERSEGTVACQRDRGLDEGSARPMPGPRLARGSEAEGRPRECQHAERSKATRLGSSWSGLIGEFVGPTGVRVQFQPAGTK
jgi:hypothetical protein